MSLPGAWPAAPNGMPASITSGPGTSSWSPRLSRMARSVRHLTGIARPRPVTRPGDTGTLVDQLRKRDPNQPTALRAWRTSHGWQLEPEPLCPAHSISTKD